MIVWRGWGILALIIPVAIWWLVPEALKAVMPPATYSASFKAISASSILLGALALWFLGRKLNGGEGRTLIDEKTGERVVVRGGHSLFFLNMEYWAVPLAVLSLVMFFG